MKALVCTLEGKLTKEIKEQEILTIIFPDEQIVLHLKKCSLQPKPIWRFVIKRRISTGIRWTWLHTQTAKGVFVQ